MTASAAPALQIVPVPGQDTTGLRFRVLRIDGRRRAFRLEAIYWTILEQAAAAKGIRLQHFIADLLKDVVDANQSAFLRVKATEWCEAERRHLESRGLLALARRILIALTAPAFILDHRRNVLGANKALIEMLRSRDYDSKEGRLEVRLGAPIRDLIQVAAEHPEKLLRAQCTIRYGSTDHRLSLNLLVVGEEKGLTLMVATVSQGAP